MTTNELNTQYSLGTEVHCRGLEWTINGPFELLSDGKIVVPLKRLVEDHGYVAHRMAGLTDLRFGDEPSESWNRELAEYYGGVPDAANA